MKILVVSHAFPRFKGDWSANFIEGLCNAYINLNCEVTVLTPNVLNWNRSIGDLNNLQVVNFNYFFKKYQNFGYGDALKNDQKFSKFQLLLSPFLIFFGILKLIKLLKNNEYSFIHSHWAIPNSIISILARKFSKVNVPIITSFPGSDVTVLSKTGYLGKFIAKKILDKSDFLTCNSNDLKNELINLGISKSKLDLVIYTVEKPNLFLNENRNRVRIKYNVSEDEILLLMVGRFVEKKGFIDGLQALNELVKLGVKPKMLVVGDGVLKESFVKYITLNNLEEFIQLTGNVKLSDLSDYYSACDIFLMPSKKLPADGLNVVVLEAMSCSKPILASNSGGNELVVFENQNGYLFEEGDYQKLSQLILKFYDNKNLIQLMGESSKNLIHTKFSWEHIAKHYINKIETNYE